MGRNLFAASSAMSISAELSSVLERVGEGCLMVWLNTSHLSSFISSDMSDLWLMPALIIGKAFC